MEMQPLIRDYLGRLDAASAVLPADRRLELVDDVRSHIHLALTEAGGSDEPTIRNVLDRLGSPEEIVAAEAGATFVAPGRRSPKGLTLEQRALLVLTVGATVLPFVGSIVGVWLANSSTRWTLAQKRVATLIVGVLLAMPGVLVFPALIDGEITWIFTTAGFALPLIPLSGIAGAVYLYVSTNLVVSVGWRQ